jgi:hypothetical protein
MTDNPMSTKLLQILRCAKCGEQDDADAAIEIVMKALSYDGDGGRMCPKCAHVLVPGRVWFDHAGVLRSALANALHLHGEKMYEILKDIVEEVPITGDKRCDAEALVEAARMAVFGDAH